MGRSAGGHSGRAGAGVGRVLAAEWLKMRRRRTTWALPALLLIITLVTFFGVDQAARRQWIGEPNGFNVASGALHVLLNVVLLLVVVTTCFHVAREFSWGTVKSVFIRPLTREGWFLAKLVSAWAVASVLLLLAAAVVLLLGGVTHGYADLMEKAYLLHSAGSLGGRLALTILLTLWGLWAAAAVTAALAALLGHPGGALATALGLGVAMAVLSILPSTAPLLLSTYLSLPWEQMIAMSKGVPLPYTWGSVVWRTLLGAGAWLAAATLVGLLIVRRKEMRS